MRSTWRSQGTSCWNATLSAKSDRLTTRALLEFVKRLKEKATLCKFTLAELQHNLLEVFVNGLRDQLTRWRVTQLLAQCNTVEAAAEIAVHFEADIGPRSSVSKSEPAHYLGKRNQGRGTWSSAGKSKPNIPEYEVVSMKKDKGALS